MSKKSLEERMAAAKALVAKYEEQIAKGAAQADVQVGDVVTFKFGRGDTARELEGNIVAADDGKVVILVGIKPYTVLVRDILANPTADARKPEATEEVAAETPSVINDGAASEDPLNAA